MENEEIMNTTAGDPCRYCNKWVWYDDSLPGYFHRAKSEAEDAYQCDGEANPDRGKYRSHDVR